MIALGNRLELFIDNHLIDKLDHAALKLHNPIPANVALTFDRPWERAFSGYSTVIKDGPLYRLYYRGFPHKGIRSVYCYAESWDGLTFTRPNIGKFEAEGGPGKNNNVILTDDAGGGENAVVHNFSPMLDTRPGVEPQNRFKAIGGGHKQGLFALASTDGIAWRRLSEQPVFTVDEFALDSQNLAFWSETEGRYVLYYRTWRKFPGKESGRGIRWISRAVSDDFINWTDRKDIDTGDAEPQEFYTNQTQPYFRAPHIYLTIPKRFNKGRASLGVEEAASLGILPDYQNDVSDSVLFTSRDGVRFDRTFMEAFLRPGPDRANWCSRTNMVTLNVVPTSPTELSLYFHHRYANPGQYLMRYTLRTDGFASVNAPYRGGEMVTKPFTFTGSQLVVNYATSGAGGAYVEVQDESGKPIPGLTLADCTELFGDQIERTVSWGNRTDLSELAGKPIRLRFKMIDADLYSLRFK